MAEIRWTDAQIQAIEAKNKRILVSAAAGSGKTAVLVERVIRKITDPENPVDLDSFIIMTFTVAAAAQMREKIYKGIRKALSNDPDNIYLRKQLTKVNTARILTIDALCKTIVQDNFQDVDMEPGSKVADSAELEMIMDDTLKALIEEKYAAADPEFMNFADFYTNKNDSKIEEIIRKMYGFAQSHPEPEVWIRSSIAPYEIAYKYQEENDDISPDSEIQNAEVMAEFSRYINDTLQGVRTSAENVIRIADMNYGPYKYRDIGERVLVFIDEMMDLQDMFDNKIEILKAFIQGWGTLPRIDTKSGEVDVSLKNAAMSILNNDIKKVLITLRDGILKDDLMGMHVKMAKPYSVARILTDLTLEFSRKYKEAKRALKVVEFSDIEHYALDILVEKDENGRLMRDIQGEYVPTEVAVNMANEISEIIVDEYQDTNELQECIVNVLTKRTDGDSSLFMVGDVKQSIYGFRMACPDLFIEKFEKYNRGIDGLDSDMDERLILLNSNFRSRKEIVDITNFVFSQTMVKNVGDIDYLDGNALEQGNPDAYPEAGSQQVFEPEFHFIEESGETGKQLEGYVIATRIEELMRTGMVTDDETKQLRHVRYSDITILTRNANNPEIEQMLESRGIPVSKISNRGFFETIEIRLVFDLLNIIDNPYQDIPFAAVLTSPLCGLSANELARLRTESEDRNESLYEAAKEKVDFIHKLEKYRYMAEIMNMVELLDYVIEDSGLYDIFLAMPQGEARAANIDFLKLKAAEYENGIFSGLFNFLRYIEKLKLSSDFGQASADMDDFDAVNMMTIHKSKGLEFPIVILAATGKYYNVVDTTDVVVLDRKLGLGMDCRDQVERITESTMPLDIIKIRKKQELYAEEMRLLYVAFTRAKEKLIVTGTAKPVIPKSNNLASHHFSGNVALDKSTIMSSGTYMKVLLNALTRHRDAGALNALAGIEMDASGNALSNTDFPISLSVTVGTDLETDRAVEIFEANAGKDKLLQTAGALAEQDDECTQSNLAAELGYEYPYMYAALMTAKMTASSLEDHSDYENSLACKNENSQSDVLNADNGSEKEHFINNLDKDGEESLRLKGNERGNAYHIFFELLDYSKFDLDGEMSDEEILTGIQTQLSDLKNSGHLDKVQAGAIEPLRILNFLKSNIGRRMKAASDAGKLKREQQFVMGYEDRGEMRLLQGIIDAFFEEDDHFILVDYKTDRNKSREHYIRTYKPQQDAYVKAIESALGKPVKEEIIYSTELDDEIDLMVRA